MFAYCWRSGQIEFGNRVPGGAAELIYGPPGIIKERVSVRARHAYDGTTLLVPGVPEADSDAEAHRALVAFRQMLTRSIEGLRP